MTQVMLRTARIQLVPLSDDHLEGEVELDADPEVMRYLGRPRKRVEVEQAHQRRLAAASRVPGLGFWAGLVDGSFVGWWILEPPERADQGPVEGQAELVTGCCAGIGVGAWPVRVLANWSGTDSQTLARTGSSPRRWR